ncbi:MAG TPA: aspartate aminotransferase family protein [Thermoleophilaceae bacterium]
MSDDPLASIENGLKPYRGRYPTFERLPERGRGRDEVLRELEEMAREEAPRWEKGFASGAVYHGDREHVDFLSRVYAIHSQSNPLHVDLWPSATKFEAEIVAMTGAMLRHPEPVGTVTSGGTESILLAMKAYRDRSGLRDAQIVAPDSAHAAFDKAASVFGMELVKVPVADDLRADVAAMEAALTDRTVVVVGSSPGFPHGLVDPIEELSELARSRGIGFHSDACLGGFVLPFAERLGHDVPPFDFRLPGVTSMSCDTHKFGYAAKGTSVVLYRDADLRHHQYFTVTDWPGGLYMSPTFAGSRPGALSAACWAAMVTIGEEGYLEAARRIVETASRIKDGIGAIDGLRVLGDPLFNVAFASADERLDIYRVMDAMSKRGWSLNGLHRPPCLHICTTLRHTQPGVADRLLADLGESVAEVRGNPESEGGMAPVYGMAGSLPDRSVVAGFLRGFMDMWYRV